MDTYPVKVVCLECGKRFATRSMLPICPKCGGSDVGPTEAMETRQNHLMESERLLRLALTHAKAGLAPRTSDKIRAAIKSIGGAIRHADHDAARARRIGA